MLIPDESWRHWHAVRAKNQQKRQLRDKSDTLITLTRDGKSFPALGKEFSTLPSDFRLLENTSEVIDTLYGIRKSIRSITQRQRMILDNKKALDRYRPMGKPRRIGNYLSFDTIQQIDAPAALILAAEFDRANSKLSANLPAVNLHQWDHRVRQYLDDIGFLHLLRIRPNDSKIYNNLHNYGDGTLVQRFIKGRRVEPEACSELIFALTNSLDFNEDDAIKLGFTKLLYSAIIDGMTNVFAHAYPECEYLFPHIRNWWLTGSVDSVNKKFRIIFYDQGITIPGHLFLYKEKLPYKARKIVEACDAGHTSDAELLEYIVPNSITSTGEAGRGLGLGRLHNVVDVCSNGKMHILSRRGHLLYTKGGKVKSSTLSNSIGGTLIIWDVTL